VRNPFLRGPNWTSGIELGLRLTSWVWTRRLLAGWENVAQHFEHNPTFVRVVGQHQLWLETFPSVGSSANNHAVAEAAGQFCAATAFPWFQKSSHWRRQSAEFLTTTVAALTFPSGINTELASHYHLFTLELLFAACIEDALSNEPILDSSVADMVVRMADAMAAVIDTTGRLPRQGDSDDAVVLGFDTLTATPLQTLSFVSAAVEPLPWWPSLPGDPRAKYLQGRLQLRAAGARPLTRPSLFIDAGTAVLHGNSPTHAKTWFRFDFGPHGGTSIGAHSHADALSIELRVDGVDVIADAGTFRYSDTKRAYYRGTEAHSTVQIDGKNQSTSGGPFLWTQTAHTTLLSHSVEPTSLDSGTASFTAEHNGYGKVTHRRTITTDVGHSHIEVVDHLIGEEGHNIASRFILGPTIEVTIADGTATLRAAQQVIATMTLPPEMTWSVERGDDTGGPWYSAQYGSQTPTNAIVGRAITPIVSARTTINVR
jgi:hypothetical protein